MTKYIITTLIATLLITTFIYTLVTFVPETTNVDHIEPLWNKDKYVEIKNILDPHKNIIISSEGCFRGAEMLFNWEQLKEIGGGPSAAQLTIHSNCPEETQKKTIILQSNNLSVNGDELVEFIRLAYNDWLESLSVEEQEKIVKELKEDGYL